jgi:hypothetical protein
MLSAWSLPHHQPLHSNLLHMDTWLGFPHFTFSLCTENDFEKKFGINAKTILGVCRRETFRFGEKKRTFFAKNV